MTVSALITLLQKVQQIAGDVDVQLHDLDRDITTEVRSVGLNLTATGDGAGGAVRLEHAAPVAPASAPAVVEG